MNWRPKNVEKERLVREPSVRKGLPTTGIIPNQKCIYFSCKNLHSQMKRTEMIPVIIHESIVLECEGLHVNMFSFLMSVHVSFYTMFQKSCQLHLSVSISV